MKIEVKIKDQLYTIHCGNGNQKLRWLIDVVALKYDNKSMFLIGQPKGVKLLDGTILNTSQKINQRLSDNMRVQVLFQQPLVIQKKKQSKGNK